MAVQWRCAARLHGVGQDTDPARPAFAAGNPFAGDAVPHGKFRQRRIVHDWHTHLPISKIIDLDGLRVWAREWALPPSGPKIGISVPNYANRKRSGRKNGMGMIRASNSAPTTRSGCLPASTSPCRSSIGTSPRAAAPRSRSAPARRDRHLRRAGRAREPRRQRAAGAGAEARRPHADGGEGLPGVLLSVLGRDQGRHRAGAAQHAAARRRLRLHVRGFGLPARGLFDASSPARSSRR